MVFNIVGENEEKYSGQDSTHLYAVELGINLRKVISTEVCSVLAGGFSDINDCYRLHESPNRLSFLGSELVIMSLILPF